MNHPPLLSSWDWLLTPQHRGTILLDFRPGWDSITHLEQLISREEFEERLGRCEVSKNRARVSAVQKAIEEAW